MKEVILKKDNLSIIIYDFFITIMLLIFVRHYPDFFIIAFFCTYVAFIILMHIFTGKKYMSKFSITFHTLFVIISAWIIIGLIAAKVYPLPDGWGGLGAGFVIMLYFLFQSVLIGIMLLSNFIKSLFFKKDNLPK